MDKIEAKYLIGLQYTKIIEGVNGFRTPVGTFVFANVAKILPDLQLAKQICLLKNSQTVRFKDLEQVYTIPKTDFDTLLGSIILEGDRLWEKKVEKYGFLEHANTSTQFEEIVNLPW